MIDERICSIERAINDSGLTKEDFIALLGISEELFNKKLAQKVKWTAKEKKIISEKLHISPYYMFDFFESCD